MIRRILQLVYPAQCRSCSALVSPEKFLCNKCFASVKPVVSLFIPVHKKRILKVYAAGAYQDPLRSLILKKISSDLLASRQLGTFMLDMIPFDVIQADLLIPVPLHWTRYAKRGYNQAHEMAKVIGDHLNIPVLQLITRKRRTQFQAHLAAQDRQKNVEAAFKISWWYTTSIKNYVAGKNIVLVDDLYTTGATLKSMAQLLTAYEPKSLSAVVTCRTI